MMVVHTGGWMAGLWEISHWTWYVAFAFLIILHLVSVYDYVTGHIHQPDKSSGDG